MICKKPGSAENSFEYIQSEEALIPTFAALLEKVKSVNSDDIQEMLSKFINCEEFVKFLFETNSIFSLQPYPLEVLLKIIQNKKLKVNLSQQHKETGETLLVHYSRSPFIVKTLLRIDPTLIQRRKGIEAPYVLALLANNERGASFLFEAMKEQEISLLPREILFRKVVFSKEAVTLEELAALPPEDQEIVDRLAKIHSRSEIVEKMKKLKAASEPI